MGLPLSRIYAQYWGGDLKITSAEGFGLDSYLHLNILGTRSETSENLSGYVLDFNNPKLRDSPGQRDSTAK